jgi:hypothetical protein
MARALVVMGMALVFIGLYWPFIGRLGLDLGLGLGRLPGDFAIERGNVSLYVPLMTGLLVSLVVSAVIWLVSRL